MISDLRTRGRPRRFYLLKRQESKRLYEGLASVWQEKQEREPGQPLPGSFPSLTKLAAAGYTTIEDLDGADQIELRRAGLSRSEADAALAALAKLL